MEPADIVIVGAGQAGLAAAHAARAAGLAPVVLEAGDEPVGSWPSYYDSLTLFSPARYSALPAMPFPGDPERHPTRDEVVDYLRAYAAGLDADLRCGRRVTSVEPLATGGFDVAIADGTTLRARRLIAATGAFGMPHRPRLPGLDGFEGAVLHASEYRSPARFSGRRVIVVGGGNSAVQIAVELAEVADVTIATRSPLRFQVQRPLGRDVHWWLTVTGLDAAPLGRLLHGRTVPVLDTGAYRDAIGAGRPERRAMFERLAGDAVHWADGRREAVDAIILATGYRPDLRCLAGTRALDAARRPLHRRGISTTVPGLGYVGLEHQRSFSSATVRGVGSDARFVVRALGRQTATRAEPAWRRAAKRRTSARRPAGQPVASSTTAASGPASVTASTSAGACGTGRPARSSTRPGTASGIVDGPSTRRATTP
jgi:putative flavoprotein involved in K+ transport